MKNLYIVKVNGVTLYYSYDFIVAFDSLETGLVIQENIWSQTTGKHLDSINPNREIRINQQEFLKKQNQVFKKNHFDIYFSPSGDKHD